MDFNKSYIQGSLEIMMNKHTLPKLPYAYDALEPTIDAKTMEIHHTKHHQAYIDKLNLALEKHPELFNKKVEELLSGITNVPEDIRTAVRNHAGGHANHSLFWEIMTPDRTDNSFVGDIKDKIEKKFGSYDNFKKLFSECAMNRFGSGWAWLVLNKGELEIYSTPNQDSPLMEGKIPLLGLDLWEHSYYITWQWRRAEYVNAFFDVINWKKVSELFMGN